MKKTEETPMRPSVGDKIFTYLRPEMENQVEHFLRARPFVSKIPPVDVGLILDRMPEVKAVEAIDLLAANFKAEAMVLAPRFMHRDLVVWIDSEIMNKRDPSDYNMAVAEEVGHIQLHRAVMLQISGVEDFVELQQHPQWAMAEDDAKFYARALLMPRKMLEPAATEAYARLVGEVGFGDIGQLGKMFVAQMASLFELPLVETKRRIEQYGGGLRDRLARSVAVRSDCLLGLNDEIGSGCPAESLEWGQVLE